MKKLLFLTFFLANFPIQSSDMQSRVNIQELKKPILDELLKNPKNVLDQNNKARESFLKKLNQQASIKISEPKIKKLLQETEQENPLFLFSECITEGWGSCLLSREHAPKYRNYFEEKTVAVLDKQLQSSEEPVNYTSFACGGIFQDLVIMAKTLVQHPNAALTIHLIDLGHVPYIACRDILGFTREVKVTDTTPSFDTDQLLEKVLEFSHEEKGLLFFKRQFMRQLLAEIAGDPPPAKELKYKGLMPDWLNYRRLMPKFLMKTIRKIVALIIKFLMKITGELEEEKQKLIFNCLCIDVMSKQFISYLQKTFPNAKLSLYLHESSQHYLEYLQQRQLPYPAVLTTIDSQDDISIINNSVENFEKLAEETLVNNPTASVMQLQKYDSESEKVIFSSLSRDQKENTTKNLIGKWNKKIKVYGQIETV